LGSSNILDVPSAEEDFGLKLVGIDAALLYVPRRNRSKGAKLITETVGLFFLPWQLGWKKWLR
jgi:hypothetical protein